MLVRGYQSWWVWGARACIGIFFGLLELFFPAPTLLLAVVLYGAFIHLDGLLSMIIAAYWLRTAAAMPLVVGGVIGVLSGVFALVWPTVDTETLSSTLGMAAIVRGGLEAVHAARATAMVHASKPAIIAALLISAYRVVILLGRHLGLHALVMAFAVYATAAGVSYFYTALRLRSVDRATTEAGSQPQVG